MAATDLLDYNQVVEQSPATGETIPASGGLLTWNFRCDPNLSWDPSQSFFSFDVKVTPRVATITNDVVTGDTLATAISNQKASFGPTDFFPFFLHRCISSITHIIDGVTVANSNQPFADKIMQEKFLTEGTMSNYGNFEGVMLARCIDDGEPAHNIFLLGMKEYCDGSHNPTQRIMLQLHAAGYTSIDQRSIENGFQNVTIIFQPPFDLWTKHQRISGGNHQIQMNFRGTSTDLGYGGYTCTFDPSSGTAYNSTNSIGAIHKLYNAQIEEATATDAFGMRTVAPLSNMAQISSNRLNVGLSKPRLYRRMVRYTIERPISVQEFNVTEMQFFHGQQQSIEANPPLYNSGSVAQNFLLPSSTFGIAFYWRDANDSQYSPLHPYLLIDPVTTASTAASTVSLGGGVATPYKKYYDSSEKRLGLNEFYFTYGGETYPSQRLSDLMGGSGPTGSTWDAPITTASKLHMISHQLQGVYNTDMERFNSSFAGKGMINSMDGNMFFFPVAKHNNSDNSDLQVYWSATPEKTGNYSLVVVAFYDARVELSYNSMNQLEKVTKTEWR